MEYRRATHDDIDLFVRNRIEFVTSIRSIPDIELFERSTREYLLNSINNDKVIIFIAVDNKSIVSSCMACTFETAPLPSCLNGKTAELLNVYTKEQYRKNGHVKKLIGMLLDELRNIGIEKVVLEYTSDAISIYEDFGFEILKNQMMLKLR